MVFLDDGSVLTGKVTRRTADGFEFKNSYGAFSIKSKQVKQQYITKSYREDVEISRSRGLGMQETDIRRNYEAGETSAPWTSRRVSLFAQGFGTYGKLGSRIPWGAGLSAAFDQGLDAFAGERRLYMPGIRVEAGYLDFSRGASSVRGFTFGAGPVWRASLPSRCGELVAGAVPAVSALTFGDGSFSERTVKFTLFALAGWEYCFGAVSVFAHARYMFIHDSKAPLGGVGFAAGTGYSL